MAMTKKQREAAVQAFLTLLADRHYDEIGLGDVAEAAKVQLADLYDVFPSRFSMYEAFVGQVDHAVLKEDTSDMAEEEPRERLFDVMMRRFDALSSHKSALRNLMAAARRDPVLAGALNLVALRSHAWMLAAARIEPAGWRRAALAQGSVVVFARVLRVFLSEDDPGMPRTMAALDRELREAERRFMRIDRFVSRLPGNWPRPRRGGGGWERPPRGHTPPEPGGSAETAPGDGSPAPGVGDPGSEPA